MYIVKAAYLEEGEKLMLLCLIQIKVENHKTETNGLKSFLTLSYNYPNKKRIIRVPIGSLLKKNSPDRRPETNIFLSLA